MVLLIRASGVVATSGRSKPAAAAAAAEVAAKQQPAAQGGVQKVDGGWLTRLKSRAQID